ncbi:hypothetical protein PsorP6_000807 [Peronosclerospora sorghi]|uniref:Uncharacterized protein n=1 Tax=Peronosclerospora sorghi TaxID=230839 RepID=A0ACC0WTD9_9STRA|nr:hypothetical protein PsorP6_000807 [Peronosclerospora sorghi]
MMKPPQRNEVVASQASDQQHSSDLADSFALSAAFFGKKTSYAPVVAEVSKEKETTKEGRANGNETKDSKKGNGMKKESVESEGKERKEKHVGSPDTDIEDGKRMKKKKTRKKHEDANESIEREEKGSVPQDGKASRTVFVGNVSLDATQKDIKTYFSTCGKVESVRLRYLPIAGCAVDQAGNQKLMMKVCANKKILTNARDNCNGYVTFGDEQSVENALKLNKTIFGGKMIRVDRSEPVMDARRSVFIGNVPFKCSDEDLMAFFTERLGTDEEPDPIENVRLIRDRESGLGKGFGYLLLKTPSLVAKTLALRKLKIGSRELRVQVCGKRFKKLHGVKSSAKKFEGLRASAGARARIQLKRKAQKQGKRPLSANRAHACAPPAKKRKLKHASRHQNTSGDGNTLKKRKHDSSAKKKVEQPTAKKPKRLNPNATK